MTRNSHRSHAKELIRLVAGTLQDAIATENNNPDLTIPPGVFGPSKPTPVPPSWEGTWSPRDIHVVRVSCDLLTIYDLYGCPPPPVPTCWIGLRCMRHRESRSVVRAKHKGNHYTGEDKHGMED